MSQSRWALGGILLMQAMERAAWNCLAPQLAAHGQDLFVSQAIAAFVMSLFTLASFCLAYPLGMLTDHWGQPKSWCSIGLALLAAGYGLVGLRLPGIGLTLLAIGTACFRLSIGLLISGLPGDPGPAWWRLLLAVNIGAAVGGFVGQLVSWNFGQPAVSLTCFFTTAVAGGLSRGLPSVPKVPTVERGDDDLMPTARWWAVRRLCVLTGAVYLATLQPYTSMTLFVAHTNEWLGPVRMGPSWYAALHGVLVGMVILASRKVSPKLSTIRLSVLALLLTASAFALLAVAGRRAAPVSPVWLLATYVLLSLAEPYLFVVGFRAVGRLAPAGYLGRAFGAYYASVGGFLLLGSLLNLGWERLGPARHFALVTLGLLVVAVLMHRWAERLDSTLKRFA